MKIAIACLAFCFVSASAAAAEPAGARAFLDKVIKAEIASSSPNARGDWTDFLTKRLRKAVDLDRSGEEIGFLDHDPLCMCQDTEGMRFAIVSVTGDDRTAQAVIRAGRATGHWTLAKEGGAWRISDIAETGVPGTRSLLTSLERENAKRR